MERRLQGLQNFALLTFQGGQEAAEHLPVKLSCLVGVFTREYHDLMHVLERSSEGVGNKCHELYLFVGSLFSHCLTFFKF